MTVWLHQPPIDRAPEFRRGREGDVFIAEWVGIGTLRASLHGDEEFIAAPGAPPEDVAHTVRGAASAFLRHVRGQITLHASAAALRGPASNAVPQEHAVAFLGP